MSNAPARSDGHDGMRCRPRGWISLDDAVADARPDLEPALRSAGIATWRGTVPTNLPAPGLLVFGGGQPGDVDRALVQAEGQRQRDKRWAMALVVGALTDAHAHWASRLTPFVYPATLSSGALSGFLCAALRRSGEEGRASESARCVTLRPGEMEVEINGVRAALGAAERNFLMTLAASPGAWLAKDAKIAVGEERAIGARECRRRLGRRLGPELASLLVPDERGQPYRLRGHAEVERACALRPDRHRMTRLRVEGRGSLRTFQVTDIDRFPD